MSINAMALANSPTFCLPLRVTRNALFSCQTQRANCQSVSCVNEWQGDDSCLFVHKIGLRQRKRSLLFISPIDNIRKHRLVDSAHRRTRNARHVGRASITFSRNDCWAVQQTALWLGATASRDDVAATPNLSLPKVSSQHNANKWWTCAHLWWPHRFAWKLALDAACTRAHFNWPLIYSEFDICRRVEWLIWRIDYLCADPQSHSLERSLIMILIGEPVRKPLIWMCWHYGSWIAKRLDISALLIMRR